MPEPTKPIGNKSRPQNARQGIPTSAARPSALKGTPPNPKPRPARTKVDETKIIDWLGGSDFTDLVEAAVEQPKGAVTKRSNQGDASSKPLTDDEMLSAIANRLAERNILSFARIGLDVRRGVITVTGNVKSKGERLLLLHILKTTLGVVKVNDGLALAKPEWKIPQFQNPFAAILALEIPEFPQWKSVSAAAAITSLALLLVAGLVWSRGNAGTVAVYPVKGRVVMDGVALPEATIVFHAVGDSKLPDRIQPRGKAADDGGFVLETFRSADGAPEGEFVATVHLSKTVVIDGDPAPGPNLLPVVYSSPGTSPFRVKISRETREIAALELHTTKTK